MRQTIINKIFVISLFGILAICTVSPSNALEKGVTIPLVADKTTNTGEVGSYLSAQVVVTNGTGHVFVDTNPYSQVDLQGSARIAAMVASDVLGVDENSYDFYYIITIDSPIIGGPSAGGALTVATIAAMKNWQIKPGVAMTGMIDPDETIGPVGGIPFKLQAAAEKNTTLFLVPQGQLIVNTTNTTIVRRGPFITTQTKIETVDLRQLGKKLGVDVKEVGTIQDAVLEFTGHNIQTPSINKTVYTPSYLNLLEPLATKLRDESKNMSKNASSIQSDLIKNALDLQNQAEGLFKDQKYYAATSLYFQSMVDILNAQWDYQYNQESNKDQYLTNLINTVEGQIQDSEDTLAKAKLNRINDIEIIGAAESRIAEANNTMDTVKTLDESSQASDMIALLAFANERAKTSQWWLSLAGPSGKKISDDVLIERSGWYLGQAQSISTYMQALISESGANINIGNVGDTTLVQKEIDRGYYSGALFDALRTISMTSTVIELLGVEDPSVRINQSRSAAQDAINEARSEGIDPTLAVSTFEFAGTSTNPFDEISQYSYAKMIAKATESIYSQGAVSQGTVSNQTPTNPAISPSAPSPTVSPTVSVKKTPGFESIILLIAILMTFGILRKKWK